MISVEYLRALLGGIAVDGLDNSVLESLELDAVAYVEGETGRSFAEPTSRVELYDGNGEQFLELRAPVTTGTPMVEVSYSGYSFTTLGTTTYSVEPNAALRTNSTLRLAAMLWPWGERNVRVTYTGGFESADVPREIYSLVAAVACWMFKSRTVAVSASPLQQSANSLSTVLPKHLERIIARWRLPRPAYQPRLIMA